MSTETPLETQKFWNCISIFLRNFHAVNKKIFACKILSIQKVIKGLKELDAEHTTWQTVEQLQQHDDVQLKFTTETELNTTLANSAVACSCEGFVLHMTLLTKKLTNNIEAIVIVDLRNNAYVCRFLGSQLFDDFVIKLQQQQLEVQMLTQRLDVEVSTRWCTFVLRPKLMRWCAPQTKAGTSVKQQLQSLQLIDIESYNDLYKELKTKHAHQALTYWSTANESTDPLKFIYEDLAIAAYLICLWRRHACAPTAFADLGCGNGLLVHILAAEGFRGYGYDIRARKIWSLYPPQTQLFEQAIEPEHFKLPADVDWLLGNHSDELSPWLPVLAATASHMMRYFLLPCCAYEFSGAKFQRRNSNLSSYADFLQYAQQISDKCGFQTLMDRLKIPSTKRIALVGIARLHSESEHTTTTQCIWSFVRAERAAHSAATADIKLREKHEAVRNCTQVDKRIIDDLVLKILQLLLNGAPQGVVNADAWNAGGRLSMRCIVDQLTPEDLRHIKSECGGIKTLLRNKHEIFEFCPNNLIGIRRPQVRQVLNNSPQTVKKRSCFFQQHHPNGCPLSDAQCTFIHV